MNAFKSTIMVSLSAATVGLALVGPTAQAAPRPAGHAVQRVKPAATTACTDPSNYCIITHPFYFATQLNYHSPNFKAQLVFQDDGNLVVYDETGNARWSARSQGRGGVQCVLQDDGNLVVYDSNFNPLWASVTYGNDFDYLVVQGDGNVVIYNSNNVPIWATGTEH